MSVLRRRQLLHLHQTQYIPEIEMLADWLSLLPASYAQEMLCSLCQTPRAVAALGRQQHQLRPETEPAPLLTFHQ